jgi:hypothetical protein
VLTSLHVHFVSRKRWSSIRAYAAPPSFLAGQLAAADQSCRTASHILSGMCDEPETSDFSKKFIDTLSAQISRKSDFDKWFLEGGAIEVRPFANSIVRHLSITADSNLCARLVGADGSCVKNV